MVEFKPAILKLQSGRTFSGFAPHYQVKQAMGEVIFTTGMTGYEETLTDPSYAGQILSFTFPILGNYGVSDGQNFESSQIHAHGVICAHLFEQPRHYSAQDTFLNWLRLQDIPLICGVDTRELTKELRHRGAVAGIIHYPEDSSWPEFSDQMAVDWVAQVAPRGITALGHGKYKIILVDCGAKENIIRSLLQFDITLKRVPFDYDYSAEEFDGVLISNGPGDPQLCKTTIAILARAMARAKPIFGICLGSQLMALAIGASTYKLKYGHRGHNQPCIDLQTQRCYLTSQNHSYAVAEDSLPHEWQVTFRHLNDNTVAGICHTRLPFAAVQFHPEASSGPQDTFYLFAQFMDQVRQKRAG